MYLLYPPQKQTFAFNFSDLVKARVHQWKILIQYNHQNRKKKSVMGQNLCYNKDEIYFYGTKWSSRIDLIDADDEYYNLSFSDAEKDNFDDWINLSENIERIYFCSVSEKYANTAATVVSGNGGILGNNFNVLETKNWYWSVEIGSEWIIQRSKKFVNVFFYQKGIKRYIGDDNRIYDKDKEYGYSGYIQDEEDENKVSIWGAYTAKELTLSDVLNWMGYPNWEALKDENEEYEKEISIFDRLEKQNDVELIELLKKDKANSIPHKRVVTVDKFKDPKYYVATDDDQGFKTITYRKGSITIRNFSLIKKFVRGFLKLLVFIFGVSISYDVIYDIYIGSAIHIV